MLIWRKTEERVFNWSEAHQTCCKIHILTRGVSGYQILGGQVVMWRVCRRPAAPSILPKSGWAIAHPAQPPLTPLHPSLSIIFGTLQSCSTSPFEFFCSLSKHFSIRITQPFFIQLIQNNPDVTENERQMLKIIEY